VHRPLRADEDLVRGTAAGRSLMPPLRIALALAAALAALAVPTSAGGEAKVQPDPPGPALAPGVPDRHPIAGHAHGGVRGTVILVHGGSWTLHGALPRAREHHRHAVRLNRLGYDTLAITYRPGALALPDVLAFYDRLRARLGARATVCAMGDSAGAHLSLMLAALRPSLDCAISRAAPTDLRAAHGVWRPVVERRLAAGGPLAELSPVTYADRLAGRVLASHGRDDPTVRHAQLVRLRRAGRGRIRTITLPPGQADFAHAPVARSALAALERAEARLLAAARRAS
jgi:dienelactone hydrolase